MNNNWASVAADLPATENSPFAQLDFLKLTVAAAEGHLRTFDTKTQIALAAFVLSWNPLFAMFHSACRQGVAAVSTTLLAAAVVATILCYAYAVWPSSVPRRMASASLYFLTRESAASASELVSRLQAASFVEMLADEALKLSHLRRKKTVRLKLALGCTVASYAVFLVLLMWERRCA